MAVKKKNRRIFGLDGLKTLALLGVLLYHTFPSFLPGGFLGVVLFLVISGYLSAYGNLKKMEDGTFSYGKYYLKRVVRLYPSLIIVLLAAIGILTLLDPIRLANTQSEFASVVFGYNNFWQVKMNADYFAQLSKNSPFTHLWYIAILLQFDLVFPFLLKGYVVLKNKAGKWKALGIGAVIVLLSAMIMPVCHIIGQGSNLTALYYNTFTRVSPLLAGVLLGLMHQEKIHILNRHLRRPIFSLSEMIIWMGIYIWLYFRTDGTDPAVYLYWMNICTLIAMRMIEVVVTGKTTGRILDNLVCKWIGKYNYEIYLWQYPVLLIAGIVGCSGTWYFYCLQIIVILILSIWSGTVGSWLISLVK